MQKIMPSRHVPIYVESSRIAATDGCTVSYSQHFQGATICWCTIAYAHWLDIKPEAAKQGIHCVHESVDLGFGAFAGQSVVCQNA